MKVTVKVDEVSTTLTVMDGSMVKLQRNVNYGLADAIAAVSYTHLDVYKRQNGMKPLAL